MKIFLFFIAMVVGLAAAAPLEEEEQIFGEEVEERELSRFARSPFREGGGFPGGRPNGGQSGKRGGGDWNIGVNKDQGRGPQIRAEGRGNIYSNPSGSTRIDAHGSWEAGRGRKPSTNIGISGRWRRQAQDNRKGGGSVSISRDQTRGQKPVYRVDAEKNIWKSNNGRSSLDAQGHYQTGGGMRRDYGGGVRFTHRFRRDAEVPEEYQVHQQYLEDVADLE